VVWVAVSDEDMAYSKDVFSQTEYPSCACIDEDSITFTKINEEAGPASFDGGDE
jgi:hypothetical protein